MSLSIVHSTPLLHNQPLMSSEQVPSASTGSTLETNEPSGAEQEVRSAKQEVRSAEQEVRSAEQEVRSAEQEVRSAEQEVRSAEQEVRSAKQTPAITQIRVQDHAGEIQQRDLLDNENWSSWHNDMMLTFNLCEIQDYVLGQIRCPNRDTDPVGANNWCYNDTYTQWIIRMWQSKSPMGHGLFYLLTAS